MQQRVSIVTVGVTDVHAARSFYERLGWRAGLEVDETVFFQIGDLLLILWSRAKLAEDLGVTDGGGWGGIALAQNVHSTDEVDRVIEEARAAGALIGREPADTFYGGYAGVFVDPDGDAWEVAFNPGLELGDDGSLRLPRA